MGSASMALRVRKRSLTELFQSSKRAATKPIQETVIKPPEISLEYRDAFFAGLRKTQGMVVTRKPSKVRDTAPTKTAKQSCAATNCCVGWLCTCHPEVLPAAQPLHGREDKDRG